MASQQEFEKGNTIGTDLVLLARSLSNLKLRVELISACLHLSPSMTNLISN